MQTKTSSEKTKKKSLYLAVLFIAGFLLLIIIAFIIRVTILFSHSTFNSRNNYLLEVLEKNNHAMILVFTPDTQTASILHIDNTVPDIGKQLGIPIDGILKTSTVFDNDSLPKVLWNLVIQFHTYRAIQVNQADIYKLFLFSQSLKTNAIVHQDIHLPLSDQSDLKNLSRSVIDHTLFEEGQSISVVNATGKSGRGTQLTKLLTNIGGNVISVSTADQLQQQSVISYSGSEIYTIRRLKKILGFPIKNQKPPISDIMIIIGKDTDNSAIF